MAEGTNVGNIYLDLIVRNTVGEQVQKIAQEGQATAKKAFSGMEKATESMANQASASAEKVMQKTAAAVSRGFDRSVATAQARVRELEREFERLNSKAVDVRWSFSVNEDGDRATDRLAERLAVQSEKAYDRLEAARERLRIAEEAAAQRTAAAAEKAALRQQMAAQKAAEKAAAAAQRSAEKRKAAEQKAAAEAERAAQRAVAAAEKAASRRKAITASMWKNMLSHAGSAAKKITSKIFGIDKGLNQASMSGRRFSSRLREIATGALLFNGISRLLHNLTSYLGNAIASTDQMRSALANLKGAAATAASPIIQALTPALAKLANMAATVFYYISRLISFFTGKSLSSMSSAAQKTAASASSSAKKITNASNAVKKAAATLASFDEIEKASSTETDDTSGDDGIGFEDYAPNFDFQGSSPFLDSILEAIKAGQWERVSELIAEKLNSSLAAIPWDSIQEKVRSGMQAIADIINGFVGKLDCGLVGRTLAEGLNTITTGIDAFFQGVNWEKLGSQLGIGLNDLFDTVDWSTLGRVLTDRFKAIFETLHGFVQTFKFEKIGTSAGELITAAFQNIDWGKAGQSLSDGIKGLLDAITVCIEEINWQEIGDKIEEFIDAIDWSGLVSSLVRGIGAAIGGLAAMLWAIIEDEWNSMMETWLHYTELAGGDVIAGLLLGILDGLASIGQWIVDNIFTPFMEGFKNAFGIHSPSTVMEEQGGFLVQGLLNGITNAWTSITEFFGTALDSLTETLSAGWERIKEGASTAWEKVSETVSNAWSNIKTWVADAGANVQSSVSNAWANVKAAVTGELTATENTSATAWNAIESTALSTGNSIDAATASTWANVEKTISEKMAAAKSTAENELNTILNNTTTTLTSIAEQFSIGWKKIASDTELEWQEITSSVKIKTDEMVTSITQCLEKMREQLSTNWKTLQSDATDAVKKIAENLKNTFSQIQANAVTTFTQMRSTITQLWNSTVSTLNSNNANLLAQFKQTWANLQATTQSSWNSMTSWVISKANEMRESVTNAMTTMQQKISSIWSSIYSTTTSMSNNCSSKVQSAFRTMSNNAVTSWSTMHTNIVRLAGSIVETVSSMANSVIDSAVNMANAIASAVASSIANMNTLASLEGGSSGGSSSEVTGTGPTVTLATGGITTGPTYALIGEAGREAVLPLENNTGWMNVLARRISTMIQGSIPAQPVLSMIDTSSVSTYGAGSAVSQTSQEASLASTIRDLVDRNQDSLDQVVNVLKDILEAILGIEIGDDTIAQAVDRYNTKMAIVRGGDA